MENQANVADQNIQQVEQIRQNPAVQHPTLPTLPEKAKTNWLILLIFLILGIVVGIIGLLGYQKYFASKPIVVNTPASSPTPSTTPDPTAEWKTYNDPLGQFSFKYPQNYQVEERSNDFFVITLPDEQAPQAGIMIDARLQGNYESFDRAKETINNSLVVSQRTKMGDWDLFVGVGKEGMIDGVGFKHAISPYKNGAISIETVNTAPYKDIFEDVVRSFRFMN